MDFVGALVIHAHLRTVASFAAHKHTCDYLTAAPPIIYGSSDKASKIE